MRFLSLGNKTKILFPSNWRCSYSTKQRSETHQVTAVNSCRFSLKKNNRTWTGRKQMTCALLKAPLLLLNVGKLSSLCPLAIIIFCLSCPSQVCRFSAAISFVKYVRQLEGGVKICVCNVQDYVMELVAVLLRIF